jgi:hypothetical protein
MLAVRSIGLGRGAVSSFTFVFGRAPFLLLGVPLTSNIPVGLRLGGGCLQLPAPLTLVAEAVSLAFATPIALRLTIGVARDHRVRNACRCSLP